MATPRRRVSDHSNANAISGITGREPGFLRAWGNSGALGIPATSHLGYCGDQGTNGQQNGTEDLAILSDLISGLAGETAPAICCELIEACGSLVGVLAAAKFRELPIPQLSDDVRHRLQYFAEALGSMLRQEALVAPIFSSSQALARYLQFEMAPLKRETFRVLFLDSANALLRDQTMWEGSVNRVQIHPREVVSVALETHASALVLVHNHPSGKATPSVEDIELTRRMVKACELLDIAVHDHLIVAKQEVFSMRAQHIVAFNT